MPVSGRANRLNLMAPMPGCRHAIIAHCICRTSSQYLAQASAAACSNRAELDGEAT